MERHSRDLEREARQHEDDTKQLSGRDFTSKGDRCDRIAGAAGKAVKQADPVEQYP